MIRVLFVDDEADILEGLENRLRPMRLEWSMSFRDSAVAALTFLSTRPVDVIVTDMRMPGMDGAALLREVRRLYPQTVRIILSGQTDRDGVLRALPVAHQFLAKPCNSDSLRQAIEQSCGLHSRLFSPAVKRVIASLGALPVLPRLYWDIAAELDLPEPSVTRVTTIIEHDPAMTARLLQIVNSAFFSRPRTVCSVREAVTLLGLEPVRGFVLSTELIRAMSATCEPHGQELQALQAHSLQVSAVAESLSVDAGVRAVALTAGLLHDIGRMVLGLAPVTGTAEILALPPVSMIETVQMEQQRHGCSHAEVGACLLAMWGLPPQLVEAVAYHHRPSALLDHQAVTPVQGVVSAPAAVHVADWLVHRRSDFKDLDGHEDAFPQLDREYLQRTGLIHRLDAWAQRHGVRLHGKATPAKTDLPPLTASPVQAA